MAIVATGLLSGAYALRQLARGTGAIPAFQAPQYWLDYGDGFVRRGLLGQLLSWLSGGNPSSAAMAATGLLVSGAAVAAILALTWRAVSRTVVADHRLLLAALLIASPVAASLALHDLGRYDAIGFVAMLALVALPWQTRWVASSLVAAAVVAVATASEEFLLAFLAPIVVLALWRVDPGRQAYARATATLAPAAGLALASLLAKPSAGVIDNALARAAAAGVPTEGNNAVSTLRRSVGQQIEHVGEFSTTSLALWFSLCAGLFAVAVAFLWHLTGGTRALTRVAASYAVLAAALCVIGVDYRRWWALALVGVVACASGLRRGERPVRLTRRWYAVLFAALVVSIPLQFLPVYPVWGG